MYQRQALKNTIQEQQLIHIRIILAALVVCLLVSIIVVRFFYLHIIQHEVYATKSESNRVQLQRIAPKRGLIVDREQRVLAENVPSYLMALIHDRIDDVDAIFAELKRLELLTDKDILRYQKRKKRYRAFEAMPIRFNLSDEDIAKVAANRIRLAGVEIKANLARHYPYNELFAHSIGYVGRINQSELQRLNSDNYGNTNYIGKIGIERKYEGMLHGFVGYEYVETNARGETLRTLDRIDPTPGHDLTLHIDLDLQKLAMQALKNRRGAVVALDANTGGVLAAASSPSFDPNEFVRGISYSNYQALQSDLDLPLFNRFLQAQYPPGSTVKPIVGLVGLEEKAVTLQTKVPDPGWYQLPNDTRLYRDWKREGHADEVGFIQAMEQSCDVYYYDLAYKLGVTKISNLFAEFGLGKRTNIDLLSERYGINPSPTWKRKDGRGSWFAGDTLNMGIGQGYMLTTPLQLAYATNIIANKGKRLLPQMVASIDGKALSPRFLSPIKLNKEKHWNDVHDAMEAVVHGRKGTAKSISRRLKYRIAGKTGTAQVVGIAQGEKYDSESLLERQRDHALFVGFAPVKNPQISVAVIVENGEHGSTTAAPIARILMDAWMNKLAAKQKKAKQKQSEAGS